MADSDIYEDACSKIAEASKNNTQSFYQDAQSKSNPISKRNENKENESSIYQDAQSKIASNSGQHNNISKADQERDDIELKKEFLKKNEISYHKYDEEEKNTNIVRQKENKEFFNEYNDIYNKYNEEEYNEANNEDNKSESYYSEPNANNIVKSEIIFEGESKKGGCCNIPKCIIF